MSVMEDHQEANGCDIPQRGSLYVNNRSYKIFDGLNVIGRNTAAAVNIKDINISRNHAIIAVIGSNQHFIADFNSSNGTELNKTRLSSLKLYPLGNNDNLHFAEVSAVYRMGCHDSESYSNDDTQTSHPTQELYVQSTQLLTPQNRRKLLLEDERNIVSVGSATSNNDPRDNFETTNFHEATTQMIPNEALPVEDDSSSAIYDYSFHNAETQVVDWRPQSCSRDQITGTCLASSSSPCELATSNRNQQEHMEEDSEKCTAGTSKMEGSCLVTNDNSTEHSQMGNINSNESESSVMQQKSEEDLESQVQVGLLKRKKRTVLNSDDESDESETNVEVSKESTASTSKDHATLADNLQDIPNENGHKGDSKLELSCQESNEENPTEHSQTGNNSNESEDFIMLHRADELVSQVHVELLKRKKRTVLDSDDESGKIEKIAATTCNDNSVFVDNLSSLPEVQNEDANKVDSDCETYIEDGDHSNDGHDELYNESNVIPATQEDLSEVFNYKAKSPRLEPSTSHTFESSEDSFRLGLTQLMKDKADISQAGCSSNMSKNSTLNVFNDITQRFMSNPSSTLQGNYNQVHVESENNADKNKQIQICSTPIQKGTCLQIKHEKDSSFSNNTINDDDTCENTQLINQETDNIYVLPTQILPAAKINSSNSNRSIRNSPKDDHVEVQKHNANEPCSPKSPSNEDDIYIESTQCIKEKVTINTDNIYKLPTQKLPSSLRKSRRLIQSSAERDKVTITKTAASNRATDNTTEQSTLDENRQDSIFFAETEKIPQNELVSVTAGPIHALVSEHSAEGRKNEIGINSAADNVNVTSKENNSHHIYSLETQQIIHPQTANTQNHTHVSANNLETQTEVSFSQENSKPTRVLCERPANPLVMVLRDDTQGDFDGENTQEQSIDNHSDTCSVKASENANCESIQGEKVENDKSDPEEVLYQNDNKVSESTTETISHISDSTSNITKSNITDCTLIRDKALLGEKSSKNEDSDITEGNTRLTPKAKKTAKKASSGKKSDAKETRPRSVRLSRKRSGDSLSSQGSTHSSDVTNDVRIDISSSSARDYEKSDKQPAMLPKKRRILNTIFEKVDELQNKNEASSVDDSMARRSKRKILSNVDEVEPEPAPKVVVGPLQKTSPTPQAKYTRSTHRSNSSEICLTSKSTMRKSKVTKSKTENAIRGQDLSGDEFERSSKISIKSADERETVVEVKDAKNDSKLPKSEVKVTRNNRISTRNRKKSDNLNENEVDHQELEKQNTSVHNNKKRKQTPEKLPVSRSSSASNTVTSIPEVQTPSTSRKRRQKLADIENSSTSSSENFRGSSTSISTLNTPERKKRTLKPKVVFTMMESPLLESTVKHLGGSIVDSVTACTVLITEKVKRTLKLLTAIGDAKPICSPEWIHESKKARQFLDPWDFILRDPEAEEKWDFSLPDSLRRSANTKLMDGLNFHIISTDNIADVLKSAIESCGGKCLKRLTRNDSSTNIYLVTSQECKSKCMKLKKTHKNTIAIDPEAILQSVLRQELRLEEHLVED